MTKILGLAHVGIFVNDVEKSKEFYSTFLGTEVVWDCQFGGADNSDFTVSIVQNGTAVLELVQRKESDVRTDGVIDHIAFQVDDLEGVMTDLAGKGIEFETDELVHEPAMLKNGSKWIFFRGPDGEHIELAQAL